MSDIEPVQKSESRRRSLSQVRDQQSGYVFYRSSGKIERLSGKELDQNKRVEAFKQVCYDDIPLHVPIFERVIFLHTKTSAFSKHESQDNFKIFIDFRQKILSFHSQKDFLSAFQDLYNYFFASTNLLDRLCLFEELLTFADIDNYQQLTLLLKYLFHLNQKDFVGLFGFNENEVTSYFLCLSILENKTLDRIKKRKNIKLLLEISTLKILHSKISFFHYILNILKTKLLQQITHKRNIVAPSIPTTKKQFEKRLHQCLLHFFRFIDPNQQKTLNYQQFQVLFQDFHLKKTYFDFHVKKHKTLINSYIRAFFEKHFRKKEEVVSVYFQFQDFLRETAPKTFCQKHKIFLVIETNETNKLSPPLLPDAYYLYKMMQEETAFQSFIQAIHFYFQSYFDGYYFRLSSQRFNLASFDKRQITDRNELHRYTKRNKYKPSFVPDLTEKLTAYKEDLEERLPAPIGQQQEEFEQAECLKNIEELLNHRSYGQDGLDMINFKISMIGKKDFEEDANIALDNEDTAEGLTQKTNEFLSRYFNDAIILRIFLSRLPNIIIENFEKARLQYIYQRKEDDRKLPLPQAQNINLRMSFDLREDYNLLNITAIVTETLNVSLSGQPGQIDLKQPTVKTISKIDYSLPLENLLIFNFENPVFNPEFTEIKAGFNLAITQDLLI